MKNLKKYLILVRDYAIAGAMHVIRLIYYTGREFIHDQIPTRAAALTYFTMLSLIPLLMLTFAAFKTFGGESLVENTVKPLIFRLLSTGAGESVSGSIDQLLRNSRAGTLGAIGFVFLILTAFSLMDQAEFTFNVIWSENKRRSTFRRWMFYWAALSIFPLLVGLSVSMTAYLGSLKEVQELTEQVTPRVYNYFPFILQGTAFFLMYKFLPKIKVRILPALAGAAAASIIWEFLKKGYLFYTSNALNYNVIYGSLATIPLFMIWLFISWLIVLLGAELSFAWQNYRVIGQSLKGVSVPFQMYEILGLEIMLESARRFIKGEKAVVLYDYIDGKTLQTNLVETSVEKLVQAGLLKHSDGELILAQDPDKITVDNILVAIKSGGEYELNFKPGEEHRIISDFLNSLDESSKSIRSDWSLRKIINQYEELKKVLR